MQTHTHPSKHTVHTVRGIYLKLYPVTPLEGSNLSEFSCHNRPQDGGAVICGLPHFGKGAKCANAKICEQPRQERGEGWGGSISMHALIRDSAGHMLRVSSPGFGLLCFALDRFGSVCVDFTTPASAAGH